MQGKEVCRRLPFVAWPHFFVGSLMAKQNRLEEAAEYLQLALRIDPNVPRARKELDAVLLRLGRSAG
jgi:Flp pilus assembly protein TadD